MIHVRVVRRPQSSSGLAGGSPSCRIGVQRIAVGPPRPSIRAIDLDDEHPCLTELPSQAGTIAAGALKSTTAVYSVITPSASRRWTRRRQCAGVRPTHL